MRLAQIVVSLSLGSCALWVDFEAGTGNGAAGGGPGTGADTPGGSAGQGGLSGGGGEGSEPTCAGCDPPCGTCDGGVCTLAPDATPCEAPYCGGPEGLTIVSGACAGGTCLEQQLPTLCPHECADGACVKKSDGKDCSAPGKCQSGFCVDDVCCDTSCNGSCIACDLTNAVGTCKDVPSGTPQPLCMGSCSPDSDYFPPQCNGIGSCGGMTTGIVDCQLGFACSVSAGGCVEL